MQNKKNLLGYSLESLEDFFTDIGEQSYRAKQVLKWIHQKGVLDFSEMTDLNKDLRNKLNNHAFIKPPQIEEEFISNEGTKKYLLKLDSGSMIEMVKIPEKKTKNKGIFKVIFIPKKDDKFSGIKYSVTFPLFANESKKSNVAKHMKNRVRIKRILIKLFR